MFGFNRNVPSDQELREHFAQRIHRVQSEQIGDSFYWYDADSSQFVAQGKTDDEIRQCLKQNWSDHIFVISEQHMIMGPDFDQLIEFDSAGVVNE